MYQTLSLAGYLIAAGIERAGGQGRAQVCPTMPRAFLAAVYRSLSHLKASLTRCVSQTLLTFSLKIYKDNLKLDWVQDLSLCLF